MSIHSFHPFSTSLQIFLLSFHSFFAFHSILSYFSYHSSEQLFFVSPFHIFLIFSLFSLIPVFVSLASSHYSTFIASSVSRPDLVISLPPLSSSQAAVP